jgi:hypothetical protein
MTAKKPALPDLSFLQTVLASADADVVRLRGEIAEFKRDRASEENLEYEPEKARAYDREITAREADLMAAEFRRSTCMADVDAKIAALREEKAERNAAINRWLAVAAIVMTAAKTIYDLLR